MNYDGYLDGNDGWTVWGWAFDIRRPDTPLAVEFRVGEKSIGHVLADEPRADLYRHGNGNHAFSFRLPHTIGEGQLLTAQIAETDFILKGSPMSRAPRQSISLVAGDIVNQCNLRCPFCIVDYSNFPRLQLMSREIYEQSLTLLPKITTPGNFWLSCLHEPTLHPQFIDFIEAVPESYLDRISFTTNLARRMNSDFLSRLAGSGVYQIRVSLDSLNAPVFSELRKKAKFDVFMTNLFNLSKLLKESHNRPRLHFITMAFKSNYLEIPDIVRYGRDLGADSHEVRYIYYAPHLSGWGRDNILDLAEWAVLERSLAPLASDSLSIAGPTADTVQQFDEERGVQDYVARETFFGDVAGQPATIPDPERAGPLLPDMALQLRMRWDGLIIPSNAPEAHFTVNLSQLDRPAAYFDALREATRRRGVE